MRQRSYAICAYIVAICTILIFLVTSIDVICFDRSFYDSEYARLDTAQSLHMSQSDLMKATDALLEYLQDDRDDIVAEIEVYEVPRMAFNEKEALHMVDVKNLYQVALHIRLVATLLLVIAFAYLIVSKKKDARQLLSIAYAQYALCFLCIVAMLGIWASVDFTSLWESFHHLCFTNDLWLLNPRTDLMINMFPEEFFFRMVLRIAGMFLILFLSLWGLSLWDLKQMYHISLRKRRKQDA